MKTKMILCCLKPFNDSQEKVENFHLISIFEKYGKIKAVKIFEREKLIKAFLEFEEIKSAETCLSHFEGETTIFGKLKIYPSKKKLIVNDIQLSSKSIIQHGLNSQISFVSKFPQANVYTKNDISTYKKQNLNIFPQNSTQNLHRSNNHIDEHTISEKSSTNNHLLDNHQPNKHFNNNPYTKKITSSEDLININDQHFNPEMKVLCLNLQGHSSIHFESFLNLFGYFGLLTKVLLFKSQRQVLIEFKTEIDMQNSIRALRNFSFFGSSLNFCVSELHEIDRRQFNSYNSKGIIFKIIYDPYRYFKQKFEIDESFPTKRLSIRNAPISFNCSLLRLMLKETCEPISLRKLEEKTQNCSSSFIIDFRNSLLSTEVFAQFQNQLINNQLLEISFVKMYESYDTKIVSPFQI